MNKKGYIFSVIMIVFVAIMAIMLIPYSQPSDAQTYEHIISTNRFIEQFEQDLPRALQITAYRSLLGLEQHVATTGMYLENINAAFKEVILNGTVNQTSYEVMDDATLSVFESRMQEIASRIGLDFSIVIQEVNISHTSAFTVQVTSVVDVQVRTRDEQTGWNFSTISSSEFSIEQLKDPLYSVETAGRVPVLVYKSNISQPYISATNDTTRLQELYANTLYVADSSAPSFLMRFTGNMSSSPYGIASLVDTKQLDSQDIVVFTDKSIVDYLYFGSSSTSTNNIVNMPAEFLLDDAHLDNYDAAGKTT